MKKILVWLVLLSLGAFLAGVAVVLKPFTATQPVSHTALPAQNSDQDIDVQREVILYFGSIDSPLLEQEMRGIAECNSDEECISGLIQALVAGPYFDHVPVLPPETILLDVAIVDGVAQLNFNRVFISHHPGGSSSELSTVHAVVNTLAANLPHIREVIFLVDGAAIETIRGHVDLHHPVVADFSLVRQQAEVQTVDGEAQQLDFLPIDDSDTLGTGEMIDE